MLRPTRLDYCQYLLSTPLNYTLTHFAEHSEDFSHDHLNRLSQSDVSVVRQVCDVPWKIKQFHRESKQLTGLESCQCRLPRIVRNHIAAAFLVWGHLMRKTYQAKHRLLSEYFCQQLKSPMIKIADA